jgi:hypothetical protein
MTAQCHNNNSSLCSAVIIDPQAAGKLQGRDLLYREVHYTTYNIYNNLFYKVAHTAVILDAKNRLKDQRCKKSKYCNTVCRPIYLILLRRLPTVSGAVTVRQIGSGG